MLYVELMFSMFATVLVLNSLGLMVRWFVACELCEKSSSDFPCSDGHGTEDENEMSQEKAMSSQ